MDPVRTERLGTASQIFVICSLHLLTFIIFQQLSFVHFKVRKAQNLKPLHVHSRSFSIFTLTSLFVLDYKKWKNLFCLEIRWAFEKKRFENYFFQNTIVIKLSATSVKSWYQFFAPTRPLTKNSVQGMRWIDNIILGKELIIIMNNRTTIPCKTSCLILNLSRVICKYTFPNQRQGTE